MEVLWEAITKRSYLGCTSRSGSIQALELGSCLALLKLEKARCFFAARSCYNLNSVESAFGHLSWARRIVLAARRPQLTQKLIASRWLTWPAARFLFHLKTRLSSLFVKLTIVDCFLMNLFLRDLSANAFFSQIKTTIFIENFFFRVGFFIKKHDQFSFLVVVDADPRS